MPTQYSANIASLESRVSELKGAVSAGSISGAPRVVTSTGNGGVVAVTTVPGVAASGSSTGTTSGSGTGSSMVSSTASGSTTMLTGTNTRPSALTSGSGNTQSSSSAFAMATEIPAAIMGVAGLIGLVAAL